MICDNYYREVIPKKKISIQDYVALGGEAPARDAGKLRAEGKSYVVKDGDVLHFLHSG